MKKVLYSFVTVLLLGMAVSGCNTVKGAGQDIQSGGQAISRAAS